MTLPPAPKFEKIIHHVVPVLWQRRFAAPGDPGPYYLNVASGKALGAQGPGDKMAEPYANIVFDEFYRPSDSLEDHLATLENRLVQGLDALIATGVMDGKARVDIAMLLALQACRYPERFQDRLDLGKYLAIALTDYRSSPSVVVLNGSLRATGLLPGAALSEDEFERLKQASGPQLTGELQAILAFHGYEAHYNPSLVIASAQQVASHLLGLQWTLFHSSSPSFILSDRPVPSPITYGFSVGLSASYGLVMTMPSVPVTEAEILPLPANQSQVDAINADVRSRAREWVCGPGSWVHGL